MDELFREALALLREWGTAYDDPRYAGLPDFGQRIREFLERVDAPCVDHDYSGRCNNIDGSEQIFCRKCGRNPPTQSDATAEPPA